MVPPRVHRTRFALLRQSVSAAPDAATGAHAPQRTHGARGHGEKQASEHRRQGQEGEAREDLEQSDLAAWWKNLANRWGFGMDTHTLMYLKWITNRVLLCKHRGLCSV